MRRHDACQHPGKKLSSPKRQLFENRVVDLLTGDSRPQHLQPRRSDRGEEAPPVSRVARSLGHACGLEQGKHKRHARIYRRRGRCQANRSRQSLRGHSRHQPAVITRSPMGNAINGKNISLLAGIDPRDGRPRIAVILLLGGPQEPCLPPGHKQNGMTEQIPNCPAQFIPASRCSARDRRSRPVYRWHP